MLRPFIVKVSVLDYFPLLAGRDYCYSVYDNGITVIILPILYSSTSCLLLLLTY